MFVYIMYILVEKKTNHKINQNKNSEYVTLYLLFDWKGDIFASWTSYNIWIVKVICGEGKQIQTVFIWSNHSMYCKNMTFSRYLIVWVCEKSVSIGKELGL